MSKFSKALEQARRDRALREEPATAAPVAAGPGSGSETHGATMTPSPPPLPSSPPMTAPAEQSRPATGQAEPRPRDETTAALDEHLVSLLTPAAFEAEQYRALRFHLERLRGSTGHHVVAVSSPGVGDGKSTTAINLAGAMSQAPQGRILLVEADLRRPSLAHLLGRAWRPHRGLLDAIADPGLGLVDLVEPCSPYNLSLIRGGGHVPNPYELLKSHRFRELMDEARRQFDHVIVDAPPLLPVQDCRVIAGLVDGFLVVVTAHRTPRGMLEEALRVIDTSKVIGLVFNGGDAEHSTYYRGYYSAPGSSANGDPGGRWRRAAARVAGSWHRSAGETRTRGGG